MTASNKDYNRVLATQPRASIGLGKLQVQNNLQQHIRLLKHFQ